MDHDFRERILSLEMPGNVSVLFTRDTLLTTMGSGVLSLLGMLFNCLRQTMFIFKKKKAVMDLTRLGMVRNRGRSP